MRTLPLWLLLPLIAACSGGGGPTWQKAGAGESAANEDLQQCRVQARLAPDPALLAVPTPHASGTPMMDRGQERDAKEDQQIRACMEKKGYALKR